MMWKRIFLFLSLCMLPVVNMGLADSLWITQPTDGKETYINETNAARSYGAYEFIRVNVNTDADYRILIEFDVSSFPGSLYVSNAGTLWLYCYYEQETTDEVVGIYEVKTEWVEGTNEDPSTDGATWTYAEATETSWQTAGCEGVNDRSQTAMAVKTITGTGQWYQWAISRNLIETWIANSAMNHGVILIQTSDLLAGNNVKGFWSSDTTGALKPKLVIPYLFSPLFGAVEGTVTDIETSDSLEGAIITVNGERDTTDANGYFFIDSIPWGLDTLNMILAGYRSPSDTVTILQGDTVTVDFVLSELEMSSWLADYTYQKGHLVTPPTNTATSSHPIKLILHHSAGTDTNGTGYLGSHCQTDFRDVRVVRHLPFCIYRLSHEWCFTINGPVTEYYNGKTYVFMQGHDGDPYALAYTHSTKSWSKPVKVATNPLPADDEHGAPSMVIFSDGRLGCFFGSHRSTQYLYRSTNAEDITSWGSISFGETEATYPKTVRTKNDNIYTFYRKGSCAGAVYNTCMVEAYKKSTDDGSTWGSIDTVIDMRNYAAPYVKGVAYDSVHERVHLSWAVYPGGDEERQNVYQAYFDISTTDLYSMGGTDLGTKIDSAEATDYCLIRNSAGRKVFSETMRLLNDSIPLVVWNEAAYGGERYRFSKWNGSSWMSYQDIVATDDVRNWGDFAVCAGGTLRGFFVTEGSPGRGGDIEEWMSPDTGYSWQRVSYVYRQSQTNKALATPRIPHNYDDGLKVVFGQIDMTPDDSLKAYAYGDDFSKPMALWRAELAGDSAVFWTEMDTIGVGGTKLGINYGNALASTVDEPNEVFPFFVDWYDTQTTGDLPVGWAENDTGYGDFVVSEAQAKAGKSSEFAQGDGSVYYVYRDFDDSLVSDFSFHASIYPTETDKVFKLIFYDHDGFGAENCFFYLIFFGDTIGYRDNTVSPSDTVFLQTYAESTWYNIEVEDVDFTNATLDIWINGVLKANDANFFTSLIPPTDFKRIQLVGVSGYATTIYIENVFIGADFNETHKWWDSEEEMFIQRPWRRLRHGVYYKNYVKMNMELP